MIRSISSGKKKSASLLSGAAFLSATLAATVSAPVALGAPEMIFHGGPIITLDGEDRIVEAIAVEEGKIVAVGDLATVKAMADADTKHVDLEGKPLLPGFVDSHSHAGFMGLQAMSANLLPAPDGEGILGVVADDGVKHFQSPPSLATVSASSLRCGLMNSAVNSVSNSVKPMAEYSL